MRTALLQSGSPIFYLSSLPPITVPRLLPEALITPAHLVARVIRRIAFLMGDPLEFRDRIHALRSVVAAPSVNNVRRSLLLRYSKSNAMNTHCRIISRKGAPDEREKPTRSIGSIGYPVPSGGLSLRTDEKHRKGDPVHCQFPKTD